MQKQRTVLAYRQNAFYYIFAQQQNERPETFPGLQSLGLGIDCFYFGLGG